MKDVVCIYSGGMDSYTLAAAARDDGRLHSCISYDYGQRHAKELQYAADACETWGVPHNVVDLRALSFVLRGSALLGGALPEGHATDPMQSATVVPNRNMIMLSVAVAHAVANGLAQVWFGAHAGDREIYPDCRVEFVQTLSSATQLATNVAIKAPFLGMDKVGIIKLGHELGLDYAKTWTCYAGGEVACGRCGSCQERLAAFAELGCSDPLTYRTRELIPHG